MYYKRTFKLSEAMFMHIGYWGSVKIIRRKTLAFLQLVHIIGKNPLLLRGVLPSIVQIDC